MKRKGGGKCRGRKNCIRKRKEMKMEDEEGGRIRSGTRRRQR